MATSRWPVPGVYEKLGSPPRPTVVRDDIAAFVGLTGRGPLDTPVRLESWEAFVAYFVAAPIGPAGIGTGLGGALLPDAVAAFFLNGGRTCDVVRAAHREKRIGALPPETDADVVAVASAPCSSLRIAGGAIAPHWFAAQPGSLDPGTWANRTNCAISVDTSPLRVSGPVASPRPGEVQLPIAARPASGRIAPGSLVWVVGSAPLRTAYVLRIEAAPADGDGESVLLLVLQAPFVLAPGERVSLVEVSLSVRVPGLGSERFDGLGLHPLHPRYLPAVLETSSRYVALRAADGIALPGELVPVVSTDPKYAPNEALADAVDTLAGGQDGADRCVRADFFGGPGGDGDDDEHPERLRGIACLRRRRDVSVVVVPDLVLPGSPPSETPPFAPRFRTHERRKFVCGPVTPDVLPTIAPAEPPVWPPALIDPRYAPVAPSDRQALADDLDLYERRLVAYCDDEADRIALLSPPPSADPERAAAWRRRFSSPFVAAFYPWLEFGDPIAQPPVRLAPPTGVAAGLIARSERRFGVGRSPGNQPTTSVAGLARAVSLDEWAILHEADLNLFRVEPDAIRMLGGRTLSTDTSFRYLHVRRLLTHVERVVQRRMVWVVFEPDQSALWARVIYDLDAHVLRPLFERGAFAGATAEESYFIRCDETTTPAFDRDLGRLRCEIGIAPNQPAEYIVFRLEASRDERLLVQEVA
jgi:uncharacterized protein